MIGFLVVLGAVWTAVAVPLALIVGQAVRLGDAHAEYRAPVIPLFPPAAASGEDERRRGALPPRLSPRAGSGARRALRRIRRSRAVADLRAHGWLVGLLLAGVLCTVVMRGDFATWDGVHGIPTGGAR